MVQRYPVATVADQTFTHRAPLRVSVEEAWKRLQEADTWAQIGGMQDVEEVRHKHDGTLGAFDFAAVVAGKRYTGRASTTVSRAGEQMVLDIDTSELAGSIDVSFVSEPAITVTLTVRSKGFFSSLMFPVIAGAITSGLRENVDRFASRV